MREPRDLFDSGFIRATQLSKLNDPFEATYCKEGLDELASNFDDPKIPVVGIGLVSFSEFIEMNKNKVGVISLTESKDNLLMWSHYANEYQGICVGFTKLEIESGMFSNLITPEIGLEGWRLFDGKPQPVMYRKQPRYRVDKFDFDYSNISVEGGERVLTEVFLQKSEEWIYEKEHRIVLRLEQADKVHIYDLDKLSNEHVKSKIINSSFCTYHEKDGFYEIRLSEVDEYGERIAYSSLLAELSVNPKNVYLFKLKPNSITHCIFGPRSVLEWEDVNMPYVRSGGYFETWKAKMEPMSYSMSFDEITKT